MSKPKSDRRQGAIVVSLSLLRFPVDDGESPQIKCLECGELLDFHQLKCLECGELLDFHQPDADFPNRMLGICFDCKTWYLLDFVPGKPEAVMVRLPDEGYFWDSLPS